MNRKSLSLIMTLAVIVSVAVGSPSSAAESSDIRVQSIVDDVLSLFNERYFDPREAEKMSAYVRGKLARGEYDGLESLDGFASQLTADLREVSEDGHIVIYRALSDAFFKADSDKLTDADIARHAHGNFGFLEARRLTGNIGYLKFNYFDYPEIAGSKATAAITFVADCDAVIFDLRENSGGKESMVQFLLSYLFEEQTHFLDVYGRNGDVIKQSWSLPYVPGPKLFDTPVFVLTSNHTGSGAEAFSYHLQSYGRATIVGETTMGIAHWVDIVDLPEHSLRVQVPDARPENPVTGTNWEGTGVEPDIRSTAAEAMAVAHVFAMEQLIEETTDDEQRRDRLWDMDAVRAEASPMEWIRQRMLPYTGIYSDGKNSIIIKDEQLYWKYSAEVDYALLPLHLDMFAFDDTNDLRFKFVRDERGAVSGFQLVYKNGQTGDIRPRTGDLR
ncbi:MAG: S41 family peptidase [Gammaproteobacteria bacterium]